MIQLTKRDLKDRPIYANETFISNGHWVFKRDAVFLKGKGSRVSLLRALPVVRFNSSDDTPEVDGLPNLEAVWSQGAGEKAVVINSTGLMIGSVSGQDGVILAGEGFYTCINRRMCELVSGYSLKAAGPITAVSVEGEGGVIGLVMPISLGQSRIEHLRVLGAWA